MDVSPQTLREVEFREKLRGYHPDDVDEFLERVAAGLEILQERLRTALDRAVRAEQKASEVGEGDEAMRRTLVLAQRTADLAVQEAREQAARIIAGAETQAQELRARAAEQARQTIEDATREAWAQVQGLERTRDDLGHEIRLLRRHMDGERERVREILQGVLHHVNEIVPSLDEGPLDLSTGADRAAPEPASGESHEGHPGAPGGPAVIHGAGEEFYAELHHASPGVGGAEASATG